MKRISLMLALFLTLSFGMVFAQGAPTLDLDNVVGLYSPTEIAIGMPVTFNMRWINDDPTNMVAGATNAFQIYSPDGADWTISDYGPKDQAELLALGVDFDLNWTIGMFSVTGSGADTISFGGATMSSLVGMPGGFNSVVTYITVDPGMDIDDEGKTICIDSSFYPPTGYWLWAYVTAGAFPPAWGGPYCYDMYLIPDLCPVFTVAPLTGGGPHGDLVSLQYTAVDPDDEPTAGGVTYEVLSGVGNIGSTSGQYTYAPVLADVGASIGAVIEASDAFHPSGTCTGSQAILVLNFTNEAPVFLTGGGSPIGTTIEVGMGNDMCATFEVDNVDGDPSVVNVIDVSPHAAIGDSTLTNNGDGTWTLCFNTATGAYPIGDGGVLYVFTLEVTDGGPDKGTTTGTISFNVLETEPFEVRIEKTHGTIQGTHVMVNVTQNKGSENMGGFDFMIAYDASALTFVTALPGVLHTVCGWEYFNYRFGPMCGSACPSGVLEVVAIAETNNGANHPTCLSITPLPIVLFSLDFMVSDDRTLECMYVPIRFYWTNCTDNSIAYHPADAPLTAVQGVSRYVFDFDLIGKIGDADPDSPQFGLGMTTGFPTYTGVQEECMVGGGVDKPAPIPFIDFYNGGVDIVCADSIDARGDVNLNGISNEIADAVIFSNYFIQGLGVFAPNYDGSIAATDVNADGLALSVADLVYLIRVIVGDALPYPKLGAEAASYAYENGVMSVDSKMGAAFVVIEGNVNPTLLADKMEMNYAFDGNNTRVLVSNIARGADFEGNFLQFEGRVVSAEFATYDGAPVAQKLVPTSFSLAQNYPNPFNGITKIAFGMPTAGDYTLTIYNVTGQKVADFAGTSEAGMVTVDWDAANQASGVYFYKLNTDNFTDTKKMVYLK